MAFRRRSTPTEGLVQDVIALALRRRRNQTFAVIAALVVAVGSAIYSHWHNPADPSTMDGQSVVCDRVIDGDTVVVSGQGMSNEHVRLRGIDAPEVVHPGLEKNAHFGPEARQYLTNRLAGKPITLKFDGTEKRDRYQRLLAWIYLTDSDCVNLDLVRDGMAYVDRRFKTMLEGQLDQLETQARERQVGLWKDLNVSDEPEWRQKWLQKKRLSPDD